MRRKSSFFDRLKGRLDRLDAPTLRKYLARIIEDKGFFESIFDTVREGIIVIDSTLKILLANPAALHLFGMPQEAVGEPIGKYFRQIDWRQLLKMPPKEWGRFSRQEIEIFYPERRLISFYLLPAPVQPDGTRDEQLLATLIFHDNTERSLDNAKAIESQRVAAITQLAAGVAHELGNPLNALGIHLQVLKRKLASADEAALRKAVGNFTSIAEQELARLDAIVKNFLNAVRPTQLERAPVDLQKLLADALQFLQPELHSKGIQAALNVPERLPVINGDAGQLTQAFFNLIKNAVQAMSDGGHLEITCSSDDTFVHLRFADDGKGISRQELSRLMEPYFTTKAGGHGLGLLIVDRIVRSHGGVLSIDSRPGGGAAFTISLPRHSRIIRELPQAQSTPTSI